MFSGFDLSFESEDFIRESLYFFTSFIGVLHFLNKDLLTDSIDLVTFFDELLIQSSDFLFKEGTLIG